MALAMKDLACSKESWWCTQDAEVLRCAQDFGSGLGRPLSASTSALKRLCMTPSVRMHLYRAYDAFEAVSPIIAQKTWTILAGRSVSAPLRP
jgi:hypothetical protein